MNMDNRRSGSGAKFVKNPLTEAGSLSVFAMSAFTLFALLTYTASDPSLFSNGHGLAHNACGRVGAYVSSLFLQGFGMGAFVLPAALLFVSITIHKREGLTRVIGTLGGMALAVMSLTVFLALQWKYWPYSGALILTGGAFGAWVAEGLTHQFNSLGSSIVSLLVFCLAIALATPVSVARMGGHALRMIAVVSSRLARVVGTYLLYLLGLVAMRTAHAAGDLLQKLIEGALRRGSEPGCCSQRRGAFRKTRSMSTPKSSRLCRSPAPNPAAKKIAQSWLDEENVVGIAELAEAAGARDGSASAARRPS